MLTPRGEAALIVLILVLGIVAGYLLRGFDANGATLEQVQSCRVVTSASGDNVLECPE